MPKFPLTNTSNYDMDAFNPLMGKRLANFMNPCDEGCPDQLI